MAALGLALTTLAGAVPAGAQTVDTSDPRGDVWKPVGLDGWKHAKTVPNIDVRQFVIRNRKHVVVIKARYTNLVANDDELQLSVDFKTPTTHQRTVTASLSHGEVGFGVGTPSRSIKCDLHGQLDFESETIRVVVPHPCIGKGEWLRFDAMNRRFNEATGLRYDDPVTGEGDTFEWSERLYRGSSTRSAG